MTWWFHLLVRRVESLHERCDVAERVARAVGMVAYLERGFRLLVRRRMYGMFSVLTETVNGIQHAFLHVASYVSCHGSVSNYSNALQKHVGQSVWRFTGRSGEYIEEYRDYVYGSTVEKVVCSRDGKMTSEVVYSE
jgi:hypothetical protein